MHFEGAAHSAYLAQSRVPNIIACNVILLSIVSIAVAMRLYVRYRYFMIRSDDRSHTTRNHWVRTDSCSSLLYKLGMAEDCTMDVP